MSFLNEFKDFAHARECYGYGNRCCIAERLGRLPTSLVNNIIMLRSACLSAR